MTIYCSCLGVSKDQNDQCDVPAARFIWVKLHGILPAKAFRRRRCHWMPPSARQVFLMRADAWSRSGSDYMDVESCAHMQYEIVKFIFKYIHILQYVNICHIISLNHTCKWSTQIVWWMWGRGCPNHGRKDPGSTTPNKCLTLQSKGH